MTLADRIQNLRKIRGISQEELADKIGVSRQAVSKWESEQSSPDLEKVILLSDYFDVTTDYLLKGIEPKPDTQTKKEEDARIYSAVGTAFNFIGLVIAVIIWIEKQTPVSVAVGFVFFAFGCMIHAIGQFIGKHKLTAKKWFYIINVWFIALIPVTCIFNMIQGTIGGFWWTLTPFPTLYSGSFLYFGACWLCYFVICILTDIFVLIKNKNIS